MCFAKTRVEVQPIMVGNLMDEKPLVSIGMPVYNEERRIRRALDSLLGQDYPNIELIISDNASTDETANICQRYSRQDLRVRYYRNNTNVGIVSNFGRVLHLARGKYFVWTAADDYSMPAFVSTMVETLEKNPNSSVAMCTVERVREDGTRLDVVRHIGTANPNKMNSLNLALALAAGKPYHLFFYGVYRAEFLKQAFVGFPSVMAGDRLFVCQIALATRFQYVDEILHVRTAGKSAIADRYKHEALGRIWQDFWGPERTVLTFAPYLLHSSVIPSYRKLWVPLVVLRFAAFNFQHRWHPLVRHLAHVARNSLNRSIKRRQ
jgi:glycosyltransferase involved in cell wall biosynthesis